MDKNEFLKELEKRNIVLSEKQKNQFNYYYFFLVTENKKYNLTALTLESEVYEKHFYDSLSLLFENDLKGSVIDIGSGGGFPGMPLKIVKEDLDLSVLDATNKKVEFVRQLSLKLDLDIKTICARAEEYDGQYDNVIARGVAPLNILLELCCKLVKQDGYLIAMKGAKYQEELESAKNAIKILGYKLVKVYEYQLPSEQDKRCNLYFQKIKNQGLKYPRNYSKIKKQPL